MYFKCVECGRSRIFYPLNEDGLCRLCFNERQEIARQEEERKLAEAKRIQAEAEARARQLEKEKREQAWEKKCQEVFEAIPLVDICVSETPAQIILTRDQPEIKFTSITPKTSAQNLGNFVALDVETTGLQPSACEIIDLAAIRFHNFEPIERFATLLSPKKSISEKAQSINHITNEMVQGKPHFQEIAASLVDFIGKDAIVGHNLGFDLDFVVRYGANVAAQKRKYYDTLDIARKTVKKQKMKWDRELEFYYLDTASEGVENYKLETLCDWYGIQNYNSHRAEGDALATGQLFKKLVYDKLCLD